MKTEVKLSIFAGLVLVGVGITLLSMNNTETRRIFDDANKSKNDLNTSIKETGISFEKYEKNSSKNISEYSTRENVKVEDNEIRKFIISLPEPTAQDIKNLNDYGRYGFDSNFSEFSRSTIKELLPNISNEKMNKLYSIMAKFVFKGDKIDEAYLDDKLSLYEQAKANNELLKISNKELSDILSKEELKKMNWGKSIELPEDEMEYRTFVLFGNLKKDFESLDEVYEKIDPSTLENILILKENYLKEDGRNLAKEKGAYSEEDSKRFNELLNNYKKEVKDLLTQEQFELLYGKGKF